VIWCICPTVFLKNPRPGFLRWWRLVGLAMLCLSMLGSQCIFPQEDALGVGYQIYQSQILHEICHFWHAAIEAIWQLNAFPSNSYSWIQHASSSSSRFGQSSSTRNSAGVSSLFVVLPKSISFSWNWSDLNLWIYFSEVNIRMSVRPGDDLQVHVFEHLVPWTILIWIHLLQTSASCHLAFT